MIEVKQLFNNEKDEALLFTKKFILSVKMIVTVSKE